MILLLAALVTFICLAAVGAVAASNGDARGWTVFAAYLLTLLAIVITTVVRGLRRQRPTRTVALRTGTAMLVPQLLLLPFVAVVMSM